MSQFRLKCNRIQFKTTHGRKKKHASNLPKKESVTNEKILEKKAEIHEFYERKRALFGQSREV